jgi:hypothetical protein
LKEEDPCEKVANFDKKVYLKSKRVG